MQTTKPRYLRLTHILRFEFKISPVTFAHIKQATTSLVISLRDRRIHIICSTPGGVAAKVSANRTPVKQKLMKSTKDFFH